MEISAAAPRGTHAPGRVADSLTGKNATFVSISWDPDFFGRDRNTGYATAPKKDGAPQVVAAWAGTDLARDRVTVDVTKSDVYEKAMIGIFTEAVTRNEAALAELKSNMPLGQKFDPKNGTFDFVIDRPGNEQDLRYVGLIEAAPAAIRDIIEAAAGFRTHYGR